MSMRVLIRGGRGRALAATLAAGALAVLGLTAPAAHAAAPTAAQATARADVAMGDSYGAAAGVLPRDPSAALLCVRSTANCPHKLASRAGLALTDVTCGGAQTKDYAGSQCPGVAPQLDALGT